MSRVPKLGLRVFLLGHQWYLEVNKSYLTTNNLELCKYKKFWNVISDLWKFLGCYGWFVQDFDRCLRRLRTTAMVKTYVIAELIKCLIHSTNIFYSKTFKHSLPISLTFNDRVTELRLIDICNEPKYFDRTSYEGHTILMI